MEENQVPASPEPSREVEKAYTVPWSVADTWLGVGLLIVVNVALIAVLVTGYGEQFMENVGILFVELLYLLPLILIFAWRRIHWKHLGFGKFTINVMGLGCGLLIGGYIIIILHNALLYVFGISAQGDQIFEMFNQLESPIWFFITGAVIAPVVEEIFFRGFLFQGFRQKYGWLAAVLLSSAIFGAAHLDPVSLIPTFVLGCVLAYVYHQSNSVWPGILFHAAINSFSLCAVYTLSQYPGLIPS